MHALQVEIPSQSPSYVPNKAHQDEIKNLLEGLSYASEDITTTSNQQGTLAIFFVGTEARLKMQKEVSETQKNDVSDTEEALTYVETNSENP